MEKGLSFETLARLYIKYIKLVQPNGPYNFLGWSFGGVLAFEISRQLNNTGNNITNIFMIDSYFNPSKISLEIGIKDKLDNVSNINYLYAPQIHKETFGLNIAHRSIKVILFKADKMDWGHLSRDELKLVKYYIYSQFNGLDTIVNPEYIQLIQMHDYGHKSWISDKEQVTITCKYIASVLN